MQNSSKQAGKAMPQEVAVWYILPAIRRELAIALKNEGMRQNEIAERLGVTSPAVSQYLKNKRASSLKFDSRIKRAISNSAKRIAANSDAMKEIFDIEKAVMKSGIICNMCISGGKSCRICR